MNYTTNTYVWMLWLLATAVACILTYNPLYLAALLFTLIIVALSFKIDLLSCIKAGILFGVMPFLINFLFVHKGSNILFSIPQNITILSLKIPILLISGPITLESTTFGVIMALLLMDMLLAFRIFSSIVNSDSLLRIAPRFMSNSSLLISIAMRYTPIVSDDMQAIKDAQRSRGLNLSTGNLFSRIAKHRALIVPMFVNSLERSFNLAESMAQRGYTKNRTKYISEKWSKIDCALTMLLISSISILLYSKANDLLSYWPYNELIPAFNPLPVFSLFLLITPIIAK